MSVFIRRVVPVLEAVLLEGVPRELRSRQRQAHAGRALRWTTRPGAADMVARYCRLGLSTYSLTGNNNNSMSK